MRNESASVAVPSGSKAQRTRRGLVEATRAVLTETGGFNAERVAERAGVAPATFYVYFPSKDEALAAALDAALGELVEATLTRFSVERILDDGLRPAVEGAVEAALAVFTSSAVVMRLALARLPESRTIRHVYRDHQGQAIEALSRVIARGAAAGRITTADPAELTVALLVALQGLNNPMLLGRHRTDSVISHLVDMIVHLLGPSAPATARGETGVTRPPRFSR